jgi:hypothetical protein
MDPGLSQLARGFAGAWQYLELIAGATRIKDPLDGRVVEAYWVGNGLLDVVGISAVAASMEERFRRLTGLQLPHLAASMVAGGVPHHSFHVLCAYPWVGLLGDDRKGRHALDVLDRYRIRWGRVTGLAGDRVVVRSQPLVWDGRRLLLGEPALQEAVRSLDGLGTSGDLRPGDWVALHWDWVCDRLSRRQLVTLRRYTARHLDIVNQSQDRQGIAAAVERG